jgi:hypothetical protein
VPGVLKDTLDDSSVKEEKKTNINIIKDDTIDAVIVKK